MSDDASAFMLVELMEWYGFGPARIACTFVLRCTWAKVFICIWCSLSHILMNTIVCCLSKIMKCRCLVYVYLSSFNSLMKRCGLGPGQTGGMFLYCCACDCLYLNLLIALDAVWDHNFNLTFCQNVLMLDLHTFIFVELTERCDIVPGKTNRRYVCASVCLTLK